MAAFERQGRDVLLGGIIIVGLVAFAISLFFMNDVVKALQDQDEITAILPEAPKLAKGAEVWIGGKRVGEVTTVTFMPFHGDTTARVAVTLRFPHSVHDQVRKDSHIRITSARIIGAPVIDISPGTAAMPIIGHKDTLFMDQLVTIPALHEKATILAASFDSALKEAEALAGPASDRMASLAPVMRNMSAAQVELASIMDAVQNGAAADFMADGRFAAQLGSIRKSAAALGPAFSQASNRFSGTKGDAAPSLKRMQGNAERLSSAIGALQAMMAEENGTFHRVSADSALLKSLHGVKAQLDSLIIEAKKNPLKFVL
jgi:ABC-type transporter Mla subunit MlaD